jgi:hypothetical protein
MHRKDIGHREKLTMGYSQQFSRVTVYDIMHVTNEVWNDLDKQGDNKCVRSVNVRVEMWGNI